MFKKITAFTLAEVLIAKRERRKMSLLNLSRTRELKAPSSKFLKQCAFTLAEVLITLGIIGIVAEMTIPTLMNNVQDQVYKVSYKKAYSEASQAWMSAVNDDKIVDLPNSGDNQAQRLTNFAAFQSYFKTSQTCGDGSTGTIAAISNCWAAGDMWWSSFPNANGLAFIDNSGKSWALVVSGSTNNTNEILVDTNGTKKPNKLGQDRFDFMPASASGNWWGTLTKILPQLDCLSTSNCSAGSYANICPSVTSHPCYSTTWLYN